MTDMPALIIEQLTFDWDMHLWPRLEGLSDAEYRWMPAYEAAGIHDRGDGVWVADDVAVAAGGVPPVTSIAWRMDHLVGNMGRRANRFFDTGIDFDGALDGTAKTGLAQLDLAYRTWLSAISALDADGFDRPLGERGGPYAADPMIALIVHVNRETIHHGAEICLLRDLYWAGAR